MQRSRLFTAILLAFATLNLAQIPTAANARSITGQGANLRGPVRLDDADPNATMSLIEHEMGNVRTTLANFGVWGNPDQTPGFHGWEWPIHSGNNFLFTAGVWVGAEMGGVHRVSTTTDGDNGTEEFWPEHIGTRPPTNPSADWWVQSCCMDRYHGRDYERSDSIRAYEECFAVYQDSISLSYVRHMDADGHVPLNIEITQRSHVWPGFLARDIILVDYRIRNMGTDPLHHVYIGLFADPDIGAAGETGDNASAHDGNYYDATHLMAVQGKFNFWNGAPTPGLFAMKVVATPAPLDQLRLTFQNYSRLTGGDPATDADKYTIMSRGQPSDTSYRADDWRELLSFGSLATDGFELQADSTLYISVAFLSAGNVDSLNVNAERAQALYDSGYDYHPPAPAENFHVVATTSGTVVLGWSPPRIGSYIGYNLFGQDSAGAGQQEHFNTTLITDTTFTVNGLQNGADWLFQLETMDSSGQGSAYAEALCRVAAPIPVTGLSGHTENGIVTLNWNPSPEPNLTGYRVTRTVDLGSGLLDTTTFNVTATAFEDDSPRLAYHNIYRVQALNDLGVYSFFSNSVLFVPWHPQHRILVLDETISRAGWPTPDSVRAYYQRILDASGEGYDYHSEPQYFVLDSLAHYDLVIWHNDGLSGYSTSRESALKQYLLAGGRLLRSDLAFLHSALSYYNEGVNIGSPSDLQPLTFDSVFVSIWHPNTPGMQFIGATGVQPGFPSFTLDTAKVCSLRWSTHRYCYLPEVDSFWPRGATHALYRSSVLPTDSSGLGNQPCALVGPGEIVLSFPLYLLHETEAQTLLHAAIDTLRAMNLDVPPHPSAHIPATTLLRASYPNPFNPVTTLRFDLAQMKHVRLAVYNLLGQQVAVLVDGVLQAGKHQVTWNASDCASGIYFAVLEAGKTRQTQKLMLLK